MSQASSDQGVQRYVLRAQTPLRALVTASGCEVVGAILLVLWGALNLTVLVAVLGALLLAFGGTVLVAAVLAFGRLAQTVELGPSEISLRTRSGVDTVAWSEIKQVTLQGTRLVLQTQPDRQRSLQIRNPGGGAEHTFTEIVEGIRIRLDADRGYGPLV